jgi:hypothetical protein
MSILVGTNMFTFSKNTYPKLGVLFHTTMQGFMFPQETQISVKYLQRKNKHFVSNFSNFLFT